MWLYGKTPSLLTVVLLRAILFLPPIPLPGRGIPHGKVVTESRQYHLMNNYADNPTKISTIYVSRELLGLRCRFGRAVKVLVKLIGVNKPCTAQLACHA